MNELNLMAVDLGASGGRCIVGKYNGDKLHLKEIHRFDNYSVNVRNSMYWDVLNIYNEIKKGIKKPKENLVSVGVDTWGVDFGVLDKSGQLLCNPLRYRDKRTNGIPELLYKSITKQDLYKQTGIQPMQINTIFQLYSMVVNKSPILDKIDKLLFMPDLINYFFTGIKSTEYSIASTSSLLNPYERQWNKNLISQLGFNENWFTPKIVSSGTILGELSQKEYEKSNLKNTKVIATTSHDTASAVVGIPMSHKYSAYISCGTWSLVGIELNEPIINKFTSETSFTNERGIDDTVRMLKNITGLWVLQECKRYWENNGEKFSYDDMVNMARNVKKNKSFIDLDDIVFLSPNNMPNEIQKYCKNTNQKIPSSIPEIILCILESLACTYRKTIEEIEIAINHDVEVIHIVGGGAQNALLCQLTANISKKHVIAGPIEASSMGNILVQMKALGEIENVSDLREIVKRSCSISEYYPGNQEYHEEIYYKFQQVNK
ncbi:MAG: rhamnulokinase [Clostridium sp.]